MSRKHRFAASAAAAALLTLGLGIGANHATAGTCNDEPFGAGRGSDLGVTLLDAGPVGLFVGVDNDLNESGNGFNALTACVGAPDEAEPHTNVAVAAGDPSNNPAPGVVVAGPNGWTGVEVGQPDPDFDQPGDGSVGGGLLLGNSTCTHVAGDSDCYGAGTLAGATVGEYDTADIHLEVDCVAVNNTCQSPYLPSGVSYEHGDDPTRSTVTVTANGASRSVDVPYLCVEFGAECD